MDLESILIALAAGIVAFIGYRVMQRRSHPRDSAPAHFFGGLDEETLVEAKVQPPARPPQRHR